MKTMKRIAMILMVMLLVAGAAQAETLSLSGTVEAGVTVPVYAPIGGTVVLDLNKLLDYEFVSLFRCVLVFWVYYFTAITVFNSLRRLL